VKHENVQVCDPSSGTVVISISVIIPAFNRAGIIREALSSVHAQTRSPLETIVIDDASADGTADVAEREGARVIRLEQNRGAAAARNEGIRAARGDAIALLDSDDYWEPHHLATVASLLERHPEAAAAGTAVRFVGTKSGVWKGRIPEGPPTVAAFYILRSSDNTLDVEQFGQTGDDPTIVADWDGDGKADPAVYRDSANGAQSYFYYRPSANPTVNLTSVQWGLTGDRAMPGDFDGDGRADTAVFRPATGIWYISFSTRGASRADYWGLATDKFVPGDYDGDGRNDLAVFRNGIWYIKQSSDGQAAYFQWGLATDKPVPADYDGDGRTDAAVYRNGTWYIRLSSGGTAAGDFGLSTDIPVSGAYVK